MRSEPVIGWQRSDDPRRDWPEDFAHENGNYWCLCVNCGKSFAGHKRRVVCALCAATPVAPHAPTPQAKVETIAERLERLAAESVVHELSKQSLTLSEWFTVIPEAAAALRSALSALADTRAALEGSKNALTEVNRLLANSEEARRVNESCLRNAMAEADALRARAEQAEAKAEAGRADTARLDWLNEQSSAERPLELWLFRDRHGHAVVRRGYIGTLQDQRGSNLRAALDAAIGRQQTGEGDGK